MVSTWEYLKKFKWNSIMVNYFKIIIIALLIPFILTNVYVFSYYQHIMKNRLLTNQTSLLYQYQNQFDKINSDINNLHMFLTENAYVQTYMQLEDYYSNTGYESALLYTSLKNYLYTTLSNTQIASIYLYNSQMNYVCGTNVSSFLNDFRDKSWYTLFQDNSYRGYISSRNADQINSSYITYCFNYFDKYGDQSAIIFNLFDLKSADTENNILGIASSNGNILHCSDKDLTGKNIYSETDYFNLPTGTVAQNSINTIYKKNSAFSFILSKDSDLIYFIKTPNLYSKKEITSILVILFASIMYTALISLIIAFLLSMKLYKSITNIMIMLDDPEVRNTQIKDKKNELMYIVNRIINSSDKVNEVNYELAQKLTMLRKSQTIALQTQITPHFLYNTLQAINVVTLRLCKGDNDASKMIYLFSQLLQTALDTKNYLVPLSTEISYAKKYLSLQEYKYKNKFIVIWKIPEEVLDYKIVKMILQPILENALHHGVLNCPKNCVIQIIAYLQNDNLIIKIINNGIPISPEKLKEINDELQSASDIKENQSIGLSNINQRLKLVFGDKYGCFITSTNKYTAVTLILPKHMD